MLSPVEGRGLLCTFQSYSDPSWGWGAAQVSFCSQENMYLFIILSEWLHNITGNYSFGFGFFLEWSNRQILYSKVKFVEFCWSPLMFPCFLRACCRFEWIAWVGSAQAAASTESAEISGWILWPAYLQWQPPGFDLWPSANHSVRQVSLRERQDCCYVLSNQRKHVSESWFQVSQGSLVLVSRHCRSDDHKIWQSPGFWGPQIICHEESDYHTWTASYMHVVLLICVIWFFCICTFVGGKKIFWWSYLEFCGEGHRPIVTEGQTVAGS